MERRREERFQLELIVRVWGIDTDGRPFEQDAITVDLTRTGVRLRGICHPIEPGSVLQINHQDNKAKFRVRWVGGNELKDHIGLELLEGEQFYWSRTIPLAPVDSRKQP